MKRGVDIERCLMPNTYAKQLAQEIGQVSLLVSGTGIRAEQLENSNKPITVLQHLQLLRNALRLAPNDDWYLIWGQRMGEHFHGPVSMAWLSAPTLGDGFDVFLKYIPSRVPYLHWEAYEQGDQFVAEISGLMEFGDIGHMLVEVPMQVMHEYARTIRPGSIAEARIEFAHPAPSLETRYERWFQCPVTFGAGRNALIFPQSWRSMPNVGHDEAIWEVALNRCKSLCTSPDERDTLTQVRHILFDWIEQEDSERFAPSLERVAAQLHCSTRTLIRRLKLMGTSYHEVVDKVKKQRACELLGNQNLRIRDIAELLGYGDAGGFVRSFKRCLGVTPGHYREQILQHAGPAAPAAQRPSGAGLARSASH